MINCPICGKTLAKVREGAHGANELKCACGTEVFTFANVDDPKITFSEPPAQEAFMLEAIKVIAREVRDSFSIGFDKALEFYKTITTPQVVPPGAGRSPVSAPNPENEELGPGVLDLNTLSELRPEARVAILARHGLQPLRPIQAEPDLTPETMRNIIREDGHEPPKGE